ncbi:hypothetical protein BDN72DRAFT_897975 [Pluteus cervinus]|uniref:Uncharacterized protein n=1 Tax=Pluteus cervinus TaxID=181527 RepID=A0ACD3ARS0_9AGAR|nr:hypothetical protein BDN72DRAFT_897975 [Pluteus cervinus]
MSTIFTNLRSLQVVDCSVTATVPVLLDLLEGMPKLRYLELATVSLSRTTLPNSLPTVKLSAMRAFAYCGSEGDLDVLLLSQLRFTKKSQCIAFEITAPNPEETHQAFLANPFMFFAIKNTLTVIPKVTELDLDFANAEFTFRTPLLLFGVSCPTITAIYARYVSWMSENLSLFRQLQSISLSGTIVPEFWPILERMDRLSSIEIRSDQSGALFNLFVTNWRQRKPVSGTEDVIGASPRDRPRLIFPKLSRVYVEEADFQSVPDDLIDALKHRRDCKKGLSSLGINSCSGIPKGFIARLSEVVDEMDWDQLGEYDERNDSDDSEEDSEEEEETQSDESDEEDAGPITECEGCGQVLLCEDCN